MAVRVYFGPTDWKVHPLQNLTDKALPAQDASVGEERVLSGLFVVGHTPARVELRQNSNRSKKGTTDLGFGSFVTRIVWIMMSASPNGRFAGTTA
jgi:hypothetical protein